MSLEAELERSPDRGAEAIGSFATTLLLREGNRITVNISFVLSQYIESALDQAEYEKLEDGSYAGSIPVCPGVIAFTNSLRACERELQSVLEDWLHLGLKRGHNLPLIGGIDLNKDMTHAEMEFL